jgi:type I restriction enzyme R subunit
LVGTKTRTRFFDDLLFSKVQAFNPQYREAEGALVGAFRRLHIDIYGNRDFLTYLRNQGKYFWPEESRELDLTVIDYGDLARPPEAWRNAYEVTEEFYVHNGRHGTREDVVFLINGIPALVVECKNASKDEAIAKSADEQSDDPFLSRVALLESLRVVRAFETLRHP